jgi:CRP/FNR family cyclic AMP-dependent transcriptional regulator
LRAFLAVEYIHAVQRGPSSIPSEGRLLAPAEQQALEGEMEQIVLRSHLFKSLDDAGRQHLLASGFVMRFDAGDIILRQGDAGDTMYLVMDGTVRVETHTAAGGEVQLAELGRGACIGEVSVIKASPRTATVSAVTEVTVVVFARHRIMRILDQHPKVRALLETLIEGRARDAVEKIIGS